MLLSPMTSSLAWNVLPQAIAAFLVVSILFFISHFISNYSRYQYWKKQRIDGPNPWLVSIRRFDVFRKDFYKQDVSLMKKYGKVFGITEMERMSLVVGDADVLKTLLVRDFNYFLDRLSILNRGRPRKYFSKFLTNLEGHEWKQTRSIMSPTFTAGKMKAMIHLISEAVKSLMSRIDRTLGQDIDMKDLFGCFTMDVIAKCAFAIETNTHDNENHPFVVNAKKFFTFPAWRTFVIGLMPMFIRRIFKMSMNNQEAGDYLIKLGQHILEERRKKGVKAENRNYNDFLQLMLEAAESDQNDQKEEGKTGQNEKKTLTDEEIIGNAILILIAGYETTASTLTFASHVLATHPEVQDKIYQEVTEAVKANGGKLDYDTLFSLNYLDAVVHETLRMYPPVVRTERTCSEDYTFNYEGKNIHIKKGCGLIVPIYGVHHCEDYYPEPEKFKPERFLPENKDSLNAYAFLSFVIGPRNCIGMRFALMEVKLSLAKIISQYRFVKSPRTHDPLDLSPTTIVLLRPKEVVLRIEKRM